MLTFTESGLKPEILKAINQGATMEEFLDVFKQQVWIKGAPTLVQIAPLIEMLEINENGTSNALTTVQKDNVVVIKFERTEEAKQKRKEFEKVENGVI